MTKRKDIEILLMRFMDGNTTLDEEAVLGKYFRDNDVPEEWHAYKEMFAYFDKGMPEALYDCYDKPSEAPTAASLHVASAVINQPSAGKDPTSTPIYTIRKSKTGRLFAAAAAVAVLLAMAGIAMFSSRLGDNKMQEQVAKVSPSGMQTITHPDDTLQQLTADTTGSAKKDDGQKPRRLRKSDIHVPHPERLLAGKACLSDSVNLAAALLAEEKLHKVEQEQQDLLNGIALYNAALNIEILTAYDRDDDIDYMEY